MALKEYLVEKYGYNEPIFLSEIKFEDYSLSWINKEIKKMTDSGTIKRFASGIYYLPQNTDFGTSYLDPGKVVQKRYLSSGDDVYGYVAGLSLKNQIGVSAQVPNLTEVATNNESTRVRDIKIGPQTVRARRGRTTIDKKNAKTLQFLDLMNSITPRLLNSDEKLMLKKYVGSIDTTIEMITKYAGLFPAKAMKNMVESEAIYAFT